MHKWPGHCLQYCDYQIRLVIRYIDGPSLYLLSASSQECQRKHWEKIKALTSSSTDKKSHSPALDPVPDSLRMRRCSISPLVRRTHSIHTRTDKITCKFTVSWDFPGCHLICHCQLHHVTGIAGYMSVSTSNTTHKLSFEYSLHAQSNLTAIIQVCSG